MQQYWVLVKKTLYEPSLWACNSVPHVKLLEDMPFEHDVFGTMLMVTQTNHQLTNKDLSIQTAKETPMHVFTFLVWYPLAAIFEQRLKKTLCELSMCVPCTMCVVKKLSCIHSLSQSYIHLQLYWNPSTIQGLQLWNETREKLGLPKICNQREFTF